MKPRSKAPIFVLTVAAFTAGTATAARALAADAIAWAGLHGVERTADGYRTTSPDGRLVLPAFDPPLSDEHCYLLMEIRTPRPAGMRIFWHKTGADGLRAANVPFHVPSDGGYVTCVADLAVCGQLGATDMLWINPGNGVGFEFDIRRIRLITRDEVPPDLLPGLVQFTCLTSKLHYRPGERIDYRVSLRSRNYPDRQSSKVLRVRLMDEAGTEAASAIQQWSLLPLHNLKEIYGSLQPAKPLTPGKYRLEAVSTDQRSGLVLESSHDFGVQGPDDPLVCETPFRFVKDFSIVRDRRDGRFHVFSITGDLYDGHDWYPDGQERTFSHATSDDLRTWTWHAPVLSISDAKYPDGDGTFKDRNVWAPHVIDHDGKYWMFYTSVNRHGSQSVSLATSENLYDWTDHPANPVFTPEGSPAFAWSRKGGACRDPMVLADGGKFYMYVTADAAEGELRGAVGVAESDDLVHWRNPRIAVRGLLASESPHVFKSRDGYCMFTSSHGAGTFVSEHPVEGWRKLDFPRPTPASVEKYVSTSVGYAEEMLPLPDGSWLIASLTFRYHGNSIYLFRMQTDEAGRPDGYETPFRAD